MIMVMIRAIAPRLIMIIRDVYMIILFHLDPFFVSGTS